MSDNITSLNSRLRALGVSRLADALCTLAARDKDVRDYVQMLASPPEESVRRIRENIEQLVRDEHFYGYGEAAHLARRLSLILDDIRMNVEDPRAGIDLMASFFETDEYILEKCDDSDGTVSDLYYMAAAGVFAHFAVACDDAQWVADRIATLFLDSNYGVRARLLKNANAYLPETQLRRMVSLFQNFADHCAENEYNRHHALNGIEILAELLNEPALFEQARLAAFPETTPESCLAIAKAYHASGNEDAALRWISRMNDEKPWLEDEKDNMLLDIYGNKGDMKEAEAAAWRLFHRNMSSERFEQVISVVGEERREKLLEEQVEKILAEDTFCAENTSFLIAMKKTAAAAAYLVQWRQQINGKNYYSLAPVAKFMEAAKERLAATVVYRALLDSILERGQAKAYRNGATYLKKLDAMADLITDWRGCVCHADYKARISKEHKRKWRFWDEYGIRP
ncbi:MAG TPA: hypothetical protein ENN29_01970 [Candidatus Hydrogenedentes bacterium]|nr:hypothetical protein [Candidatus Hydrogenedentota bacterium]